MSPQSPASLNPETGSIGRGSQRELFGRLLWRLVRTWLVVNLVAVVLGVIFFGDGELGPIAIPLLAIFSFAFALPGSLLTIAMIVLMGSQQSYSLLGRLARITELGVAAAGSVILLSLQTPGVTSPADSFGLLIFVVPAAAIWEVIDG